MWSARRLFDKFALFSVALGLCLVPKTFAQETQREAQLPKIIRKSGGVLQGSATKRVEPTYPPLAKAARVSGSVVVEVTVDEEGHVISARAISGHPLLKDSAIAAARGWLFAPTTLQGVPVKVIGTITFNYNLDADPEPAREIEKLKEQITANPNSAELYYKLGTVYQSFHQHNEAVQAYSQAIQINPGYAEAHYQLGFSYIEIGQLDKAIDSINLSLALKPGNAEVYMELSRAYLGADRQEDSLGAVRQALKLDPSFDQADALYAVMGFVLIKQGRYVEAIDALKEGARLGPDQHHFHFYLGKAYIEAGDRDAAMNEYKFLKDKKPELANELLNLLNKQK